MKCSSATRGSGPRIRRDCAGVLVCEGVWGEAGGEGEGENGVESEVESKGEGENEVESEGESEGVGKIWDENECGGAGMGEG
mmetsp:Transcript_2453/g.5165  ORF Transcript_2453/g.5165 Transcript_2453/m.5165 type:complete len:82 (+) Transcript_2453:152-397(+)